MTPPRLRSWSTANRSRRRRLVGRAASTPPRKSRAASAMSPSIRSACRSNAKSRPPPRRTATRWSLCCARCTVARAPCVTMSFVNSGYNGDEARRAAFEASRISVTVVKRNNKQIKGFIVLPKRWVVERTFGWINRARRPRQRLRSDNQVFARMAPHRPRLPAHPTPRQDSRSTNMIFKEDRALAPARPPDVVGAL